MRGRLVEDRIEERICKIRVIDGVIANYYPQEELTRCKDCKYYRIYKHTDWTVELCGRIRTTMADPVKEDDYCSKAERRTDETD